jgi:hypothetical protein
MDDGSEQPVAFASRTLSKAEKGYAQIDRKALALIFGVRQFHKYSVGRSFKLVTDHRPLVKIFGPKERVPTLAAARLQRWALILSAYDYQIKYRPCEANAEAEMLSRLPIAVELIDPNEKLYWIEHCEQLPVTAKEVAKETRKDPVLRLAYEKILRGWGRQEPVALQPYQSRADQLAMEEGCLLWGSRIVIPPTLQFQSLACLQPLLSDLQYLLHCMGTLSALLCRKCLMWT